MAGACLVLGLMVALSLYLATTFTFITAREWATIRFSFVQSMWERWVRWRSRKSADAAVAQENYGSKREQVEAKARRARELAEAAERKSQEAENTTLLGGLFGWLSRKKKIEPLKPQEEVAGPAGAPGSMRQGAPATPGAGQP